MTHTDFYLENSEEWNTFKGWFRRLFTQIFIKSKLKGQVKIQNAFCVPREAVVVLYKNEVVCSDAKRDSLREEIKFHFLAKVSTLRQFWKLLETAKRGVGGTRGFGKSRNIFNYNLHF